MLKCLKKLEIELPLDPAIPFLCLYPKDPISYYRDVYLAMFIDVLFKISRK